MDQVLPPDENSVNSQISYYDKGAILGLLLDLEIRKRSNGAKSLDDVMRYLYAEFFKKDRNYAPADFQKACELMAGSSLEDFSTGSCAGKKSLITTLRLRLQGCARDECAAGGMRAIECFLALTSRRNRID